MMSPEQQICQRDGIKDSVQQYHPNICDFIGCLRLEQARNDAKIGKLLMGDAPTGMRKVEKSKTKRTVLQTLSIELPQST